jgi:hypothetical protein
MSVDTPKVASFIDQCQHRRMSNSGMVELPVLQDAPVVPCCPPITAGELSVADAEKMAAMFKALSDPVRLRLFSKIASHPDGEACVCDIQNVGHAGLALLTAAPAVQRHEGGQQRAK